VRIRDTALFIYRSSTFLADGFYRVWLQYADILKLGVILPTLPAAFPLALPMGWVKSPPYLIAYNDLSNNSLCTRSPRIRNMAHHLKAVAATPPADPVAIKSQGEATLHRHQIDTQGRAPGAAVDVYVDDFLLMAHMHHQRTNVLCRALHSFDTVFCPFAKNEAVPSTKNGKQSQNRNLY
jgi:hypothetical protein